jgi:hypothetical protein
MLPTKFRIIWPSLVSVWLISKKSSPLKPLCQMNRNLVGSIYGRFSIITDRDGISNHYRGPSIDVSYQVSYHLAKRFQRKSCFRNRPIRNKNCTNMATTGNSCFWLTDFLDSSLLKPFGQMNRNLVGSIYGKSSVTSAHWSKNHLWWSWWAKNP